MGLTSFSPRDRRRRISDAMMTNCGVPASLREPGRIDPSHAVSSAREREGRGHPEAEPPSGGDGVLSGCTGTGRVRDRRVAHEAPVSGDARYEQPVTLAPLA